MDLGHVGQWLLTSAKGDNQVARVPWRGTRKPLTVLPKKSNMSLVKPLKPVASFRKYQGHKNIWRLTEIREIQTV